MQQKSKSNFNLIAPWLLVATVIMPTANLLFYVKIGIVVFLTIVANIKDGGVLYYRRGGYFALWIINILLATAVAFLVERTVATGRLIHEIERIAYYILVVYCCKHYKITNRNLSYICKFLLIVNFGIQLLQYFEIGDFYNFLKTYYAGGETTHLDLAYFYGRSGFRSGALYINPNVYVMFPVIFSIVFLYETKGNRSVLPYIWIIACAISIYLTGSRTGLVLFLIIFVTFLILQRKISFQSVLVIIIVAAGIYVIFSLLGGNSSARIFQINWQDSIGVKFSGFISYCKSSNVVYYIFGSIATNISGAIDMEFGYIFAWFGVIGLFWYFMLIKDMGRRAKRGRKFYYRAIQILIIVNSFSSSTVLNMAVFPFLCLVTYATIAYKKESNGLLESSL